MRLIDKWFMHVRSSWHGAPSAPPVSFVVDNVARDYYHDERDEFVASDFPYAIPPWSECFVEWNSPPTRRIGGCVEASTAISRDVVQSNGALVIDLPNEQYVKYYSEKLNCAHAATAPCDIAGNPTAIVSRGFIATPAFEIRGSVLLANFGIVVFTTDTGLPIRYGLPGSSDWPVEHRQNLQLWAATIYHILCFSFTFANCKNVAIVDSASELKPRDNIERRLKLPSFKRYTLKIDSKQTARADGNGNIDSPAYHLCRGHFATYTPERPLFGRLHGKFWIPAHTRGNKSRGEVEKGYSA